MKRKRDNYSVIDVTSEVALRRTHVLAAIAASRHPYTRACADERDKRLFAGDGVVMTRGGRRVNPSEHMQLFLHRDAKRLGHEAIEMINLIGICPIAFRYERFAGLGEDGTVPYVPDIDAFEIGVSLKRGVKQFRFYWRDMAKMTARVDGGRIFGDADDSVYILSNFNYSPSADGSLRSNYFVVSSELRVYASMVNYALRAERISSCPPIVSEYNDAIEKTLQSRMSKAGTTNFVTPMRQTEGQQAEACIVREKESRARDAQQLRAYRRMLEQYERQNGVRHPKADELDEAGFIDDAPAGLDETSDFGANSLGERMPWANSFYLGSERKYVSVSLPQVRRDLMQWNDRVRSIVCSVMNTPEGLIASTSSVRAGVEAASAAMDHNVSRWAAIGSHIMTVAYEHSLGTTDLRHYLRQVMKRRASEYGVQRAVITRDDVVQARAKLKVRLEFDLIPTSTPERLQKLYAWGLIDDSTFAASMLRLEGFSATNIQTSRMPKLSDAERKQIIFGKALQSAHSADSPKRLRDEVGDDENEEEETPQKRLRKETSRKIKGN